MLKKAKQSFPFAVDCLVSVDDSKNAKIPKWKEFFKMKLEHFKNV